jgi:hypothetical protein
MKQRGRAERAIALNRTSRWFFPLAFAVLIVGSFWV